MKKNDVIGFATIHFRTFTKMPSDFYMVEVKLLLGCASDDIPRADEIRTIVKDIWDIRTSKLRSSVDLLIRNNEAHAAVDNLTIMEINSIRPLLPHALDQIYRMKSVRTAAMGQFEVMFTCFRRSRIWGRSRKVCRLCRIPEPRIAFIHDVICVH
jgi:hypothetical protein